MRTVSSILRSEGHTRSAGSISGGLGGAESRLEGQGRGAGQAGIGGLATARRRRIDNNDPPIPNRRMRGVDERYRHVATSKLPVPMLPTLT